MRARTTVLIFCGALVAAGVGVLVKACAMRESEMEEIRIALEAKAARGELPMSVTDTEYQFPEILVQSTPEGVLVTLRNDTSNRSIQLDSSADRLVLEYEAVGGGPGVVEVPVETGALPARRARAPVLIPLERGARATKIRFVHRDPHGVSEAEVKVRK
jgi:hypothetical protein